MDEIDIDLDRLLDLEDDASRRNWLREILEPLRDLPSGSIDNFIGEILEQSKLLWSEIGSSEISALSERDKVKYKFRWSVPITSTKPSVLFSRDLLSDH